MARREQKSAQDGVKRLYSYKRKKGVPRPAGTYRTARRNAARGTAWKGVVPDGALIHPSVRPNRSRKWEP